MVDVASVGRLSPFQQPDKSLLLCGEEPISRLHMDQIPSLDTSPEKVAEFPSPRTNTAMEMRQVAPGNENSPGSYGATFSRA